MRMFFTMRGNAAHERVDDPGFETFEGVRAERALPVWSERLADFDSLLR